MLSQSFRWTNSEPLRVIPMTDTFGRPNSHKRKRPLEERLRLVPEIHRLKAEGWKVYAIAKQLRMDQRTVKSVLAGTAEQWKPSPIENPRWRKAKTYTPDNLEKVELPPEPLPDAPPSESDSVEFLRNARDNPGLAWADRIKCALAVAKLESGDSGEAWSPPDDVGLWAEALADAILAQSPEVVGRVSEVVREKLGGPS